MNELFKKSLVTKDNAYDVTFNATENNEVVANVENSAAQMIYKNAQLVDLSGRKTRVPAKIHNALKAQPATEAQVQMLERFKRICVTRLSWSLGCFAHL